MGRPVQAGTPGSGQGGELKGRVEEEGGVPQMDHWNFRELSRSEFPMESQSFHLTIFFEPLQWARCYSSYWRSSSEENQHPCSCVA